MIFAMLYNTKEEKWHPILFRPAPLPGDPEMKIPRYKSTAHYTDGFATEEEARTYVSETCGEQGWEDRAAECIMGWNGEGIPAIVTYFQPRLKVN